MLEIFEWLNNIRNNDQNYFRGVKLLEKYNSTHPLLDELKQKISSINKVYLKQALKKTYEALKTKTPPQAAPKTARTDRPEPTDPEAWKARINKELSKLYRQRRDLSNSFHDCSTKEEFAHVSDLLKNLIQTIESHKARLRHFYKKGEMLPPPKPKKSFKIPESDVELMNLRNSLRSRISIKKRTIRDWKGNEQRKKSKAQHEFDLSIYEKEIELVYEEIKKRDL